MTTELCPHELETIKKFITPGDMVFDMGANEGIWTSAALAHCPDIQIHAFEPSPAADTFMNTHGDNREHVALKKWAVDNTNEVKKFFVAGTNGEHSSFVGTSPNTMDVMCVTLDWYCMAAKIDFIDFLKIDTEGHEWYVFDGAKRMLEENRIGVIQFELNVPNVWSGLMDQLQPHGWEFFHIYGLDLVPILPMDDQMTMTSSNPPDQPNLRLRQANVIALKGDK